jgi:hypothetical protein
MLHSSKNAEQFWENMHYHWDYDIYCNPFLYAFATGQLLDIG